MPGRRKFFARAVASGALALVLLLAAGSAPGNARAAELVMFETLGCPWCMAWDAEVGIIYHKTAEGRARGRCLRARRHRGDRGQDRVLTGGYTVGITQVRL